MVELLFTANTTWTVPPDWTNENIFEVYAGGGGATALYYYNGGPQYTSSASGFAGGYNYTYNVADFKPGDVLTIEVGRQGVGGVGTGNLITEVISNGSTRYNFFRNFNFVGTAGTNSNVIAPNGTAFLRATGGGPGIVTWSNSITVYPYTIYQSYPGPNQLGTPLRLWNNYTDPYVNRYTRYPPISNGLLAKVGGNYGAGGINVDNFYDSGYVQQAGQPGVVAISYVSRTTHSPCVWIS